MKRKQIGTNEVVMGVKLINLNEKSKIFIFVRCLLDEESNDKQTTNRQK